VAGGWLRVIRHGVTYEAAVDVRHWMAGVHYTFIQKHPSPARHCVNVFVGCFRFSRDWSVKGRFRLTYVDALQLGLIVFATGLVASVVWALGRLF
jgi:hypothetical protein